MKYSKQRETILEIIKNSDLHPTAEMIYNEVKKVIPNISLGTVYRNLTYLYENDFIKHIPLSNGSDRFDRTLSEHYHLSCLKCKRVFDIWTSSLAKINEVISNTTNFNVIAHELNFTGYCHECERKKENGTKRK